MAFSLRIFLVEDNPTIRDNLTSTLEELADAKVVGVADGESAAKLWLQAHPADWDVAVIDLFLKEGSGLGVLRCCKTLHAERQAVVLTNYATKDIRQRSAELGADAVFDKSTELDEFLMYCERFSMRRS